MVITKSGIRPKQETSSPLEGTIQRKCAQTPLRQFGGKRGYNSPLPLFKEKRSNVGGLLDGLKQNYENNKVYFDILDLIERCRKILDGEFAEPKTDLESLIKEIKEEVLSKIKQGDKKLAELKRMFNFDYDEISDSKRKNSNLETVDKKYDSVDDYVESFRIKLHPYLVDLQNISRNEDVVSEIKDSYKEILSNIFSTDKDKINGVYLKEISTLVEEISCFGDDKDKEEAQNILSNLDINGDSSLKDSTEYLLKTIQQLYLIKLDIDERRKKQEVVNSYKIDMDEGKSKS